MPWPLALTAVASRLQRTIETYGPHAVAIYLGNPMAFNAAGSFALLHFIKAMGTRNVVFPEGITRGFDDLLADLECVDSDCWTDRKPQVVLRGSAFDHMVHYGPATQVSPFGRGATILFVVLSGLIVAAAAWSLTG